MKYRVCHKSRLGYVSPVAGARLNLRLRPVEWPGQHIADYSLRLSPEPNSESDGFGAYVVNVRSVAFDESLNELNIESHFDIEVEDLPIPEETPPIAELRQQALGVRKAGVFSPAPYLFASRLVALDKDIVDWAEQFFSEQTPVLDAARSLAHAIHDEFSYMPGTTDSRTRPAEAFCERKGVCQDFAHVMIAALRGQGIPAAYVSGYLRTIPPPGQARLVGADAMHAWVAIWCGEAAGWIGVDPTNDCLAGESHIVVAMGRDYADVAPVDGVFVGAALQRMRVSVDVEPVETV